MIKERAERRRQTREQKKRTGALEVTGIRIRGRWISTPTRRQESDLGSAYDGSQGVDSEDILGIPQIDFSSFQLFPDQNQYAPHVPHLSPYNNTVQAGIDWIDKQLQTAALYAFLVISIVPVADLLHVIDMASQLLSLVLVLSLNPTRRITFHLTLRQLRMTQHRHHLIFLPVR